MGIETRRNGNAYYYRKVWENGRCRSEYAGGGALGALFAQLDRAERAAQALERAERRAQAEAEREAERAAWGLLAEAQQLAALAMLAAGYRRHRGQWRKRRNDPMSTIKDARRRLSPSEELLRAARGRVELPPPLPPLPEPGDESAEAVRAIMKRCDRADATPEDLAALRALLAKRGDRLGDEYGPLRLAFNRELAEMPATPLGRELMGDDLERRRRALGYQGAPALERGLIDHLLLCELRLGNVEQAYTVRTREGHSLEQGRHWEGRLSAAQRRYLGAVEALARVRRVRVELARVLPDGTAEAVAVEGPGA